MSEPVVSICCITYNHCKYIRKSLDGFLSQKTNFNFEILIHDDASTDGTTDIIKEYEKKHPSLFRVVYQKENQYSKGLRGINYKFNFSRAGGKYIAMCEGDDYWIDPYKLQKQVDFMEANPEFSLCYTNGIVVDENGSLVREQQVKVPKQSVIPSEEILFYTTPTNTLLFKKEFLRFLPKELPNKVTGGDTLLKTFVSKGGPCKYLDFTSGAYRTHSGGVFSSLSNFKKKKHMFQTRMVIFSNLEKKTQKRLLRDLIWILGKMPKPEMEEQRKDLNKMHKELVGLILRKDGPYLL